MLSVVRRPFRSHNNNADNHDRLEGGGTGEGRESSTPPTAVGLEQQRAFGENSHEITVANRLFVSAVPISPSPQSPVPPSQSSSGRGNNHHGSRKGRSFLFGGLRGRRSQHHISTPNAVPIHNPESVAALVLPTFPVSTNTTTDPSPTPRGSGGLFRLRRSRGRSGSGRQLQQEQQFAQEGGRTNGQIDNGATSRSTAASLEAQFQLQDEARTRIEQVLREQLTPDQWNELQATFFDYQRSLIDAYAQRQQMDQIIDLTTAMDTVQLEQQQSQQRQHQYPSLCPRHVFDGMDTVLPLRPAAAAALSQTSRTRRRALLNGASVNSHNSRSLSPAMDRARRGTLRRNQSHQSDGDGVLPLASNSDYHGDGSLTQGQSSFSDHGGLMEERRRSFHSNSSAHDSQQLFSSSDHGVRGNRRRANRDPSRRRVRQQQQQEPQKEEDRVQRIMDSMSDEQWLALEMKYVDFQQIMLDRYYQQHEVDQFNNTDTRSNNTANHTNASSTPCGQQRRILLGSRDDTNNTSSFLVDQDIAMDSILSKYGKANNIDNNAIRSGMLAAPSKSEVKNGTITADYVMSEQHDLLVRSQLEQQKQQQLQQVQLQSQDEDDPAAGVSQEYQQEFLPNVYLRPSSAAVATENVANSSYTNSVAGCKVNGRASIDLNAWWSQQQHRQHQQPGAQLSSASAHGPDTRAGSGMSAYDPYCALRGASYIELPSVHHQTQNQYNGGIGTIVSSSFRSMLRNVPSQPMQRKGQTGTVGVTQDQTQGITYDDTGNMNSFRSQGEQTQQQQQQGHVQQGNQPPRPPSHPQDNRKDDIEDAESDKKLPDIPAGFRASSRLAYSGVRLPSSLFQLDDTDPMVSLGTGSSHRLYPAIPKSPTLTHLRKNSRSIGGDASTVASGGSSTLASDNVSTSSPAGPVTNSLYHSGNRTNGNSRLDSSSSILLFSDGDYMDDSKIEQLLKKLSASNDASAAATAEMTEEEWIQQAILQIEASQDSNSYIHSSFGGELLLIPVRQATNVVEGQHQQLPSTATLLDAGLSQTRPTTPTTTRAQSSATSDCTKFQCCCCLQHRPTKIQSLNCDNLCSEVGQEKGGDMLPHMYCKDCIRQYVLSLEEHGTRGGGLGHAKCKVPCFFHATTKAVTGTKKCKGKIHVDMAYLFD